MALPSFKFYEIPELEKIAEGFLAERYPTLTIPPAIDIEYLIADQKADILPVHNIWHDFRVKGIVVFYKGSPTVCIDAEHLDRYPELSRFTMAEELGHLLLHRSLFEDCSTVEKATQRYLALDGKVIDRLDRNARFLGAAIVIPRKILQEELDDLLINQSLAGCRDWREGIVEAAEVLHDKYEISEVTMQNRIQCRTFTDWITRLTASLR